MYHKVWCIVRVNKPEYKGIDLYWTGNGWSGRWEAIHYDHEWLAEDHLYNEVIPRGWDVDDQSHTMPMVRSVYVPSERGNTECHSPL